ncbi:hypothetical protein [Rhizobium leguminosarum]|uniref:Uncharacterized protein n=1 Tax=Rhizobium leguminosarum TaxID=384 RepID=A0A7K3VJZ1_RHILE|nr:hypothetical protein [Rhizobium leguminosarum]NEK17455.1 hypothetical protein [Rhizobium leguminosarum]
MPIQDLKEQMRAVWHDVPAVDVCFLVLDYLESVKKPEQLKMITFRDLVAVTGRKTVDSDLLTAVAILTNSSVSVLDARALLVDEDETEYELSPEDFAEARKVGLLIHPHSGEAVPDFENHIIPFFVPTEQFLAEHHGH